MRSESKTTTAAHMICDCVLDNLLTLIFQDMLYAIYRLYLSLQERIQYEG